MINTPPLARNLTLAPTIGTQPCPLESCSKDHQLCKVCPSPLSTHIPHFLVAVDEEQDSSPLAFSENQEQTAGNHTNILPPVEDDIGSDGSLHADTISLKEQPTHPVIEEQATTADPIDVVMCGDPNGDDTDLLFRIRGLYRLLDLINEQGSGGAGMIKVPWCYIFETQPTIIPKWTRSSSPKSPWRGL